MAKFAVGEIAIAVVLNSLYGYQIGDKHEVEIVALPGQPYPAKDRNSFTQYAVRITHSGETHGASEAALRKLPGDSTSLPSWLTNMLKVPQGDPDKVKQPEKVK